MLWKLYGSDYLKMPGCGRIRATLHSGISVSQKASADTRTVLQWIKQGDGIMSNVTSLCLLSVMVVRFITFSSAAFKTAYYTLRNKTNSICSIFLCNISNLPPLQIWNLNQPLNQVHCQHQQPDRIQVHLSNVLGNLECDMRRNKIEIILWNNRYPFRLQNSLHLNILHTNPQSIKAKALIIQFINQKCYHLQLLLE